MSPDTYPRWRRGERVAHERSATETSARSIKFPSAGALYSIGPVPGGVPGDRFIELATAEDRRVLDILFRHASEAVTVQDRSGRLLYANEEAARYSASEPVTSWYRRHPRTLSSASR